MPDGLRFHTHRNALLKRLRRLLRALPYLILIIGVGYCVDIPELGRSGDIPLWRFAEWTICGLALLWILSLCGVRPPSRSLFHPAFRITIPLVIAIAVVAAAVAFTLKGDEFQLPIKSAGAGWPFSAWVISVFSLLVVAFLQEIWHRAVLQSALVRLFGNRWLGLATTAILSTSLQPVGQKGFALCSAVLLGIAFIRTQSVVCTTALNFTLRISIGLLRGGPFVPGGLLSAEDFLELKPPLFLGLLLLAFLVELWHRRSPQLLRSIQRTAGTLLLMAFAYGLYKLTSILLWPHWTRLIDRNAWMTADLIIRAAVLVQAAVAVLALAWLRRGPPLRALLSIRPAATTCLLVVAACIPAAAAAIAEPDAFSTGVFAPISPFTTDPRYWFGSVLPFVVAALAEEVFHRALAQPLLSRLFANEWAGAVLGAMHFTLFHPMEHAVYVLPGGLLFAVVYMRTRSIVTTTLLHVTLNIASALVTGHSFTHSVFIYPDSGSVRPIVLGALLLLLTVAFEIAWQWSAWKGTSRAGLPLPPAATRADMGLLTSAVAGQSHPGNSIGRP